MTTQSNFFIYSRKSSEDEDRQMLSIDAQISELNAISGRDGLTVIDSLTECRSAKEPEDGVQFGNLCVNREHLTIFVLT